MLSPVAGSPFRPTHGKMTAVWEGTASKAQMKEINDAPDPNVTDVEFRLRSVHVICNRDPGKGNIYLLSVVSDNLREQPVTLELKTFNDVEDDGELELGPGGVTLYRNPEGKIPRFLDYRIMIMESDEELRDIGGALSEIVNNPAYKSLHDSLVAISGDTVPATSAIINATDTILALAIEILKRNRDDQLYYGVGSFNYKL